MKMILIVLCISLAGCGAKSHEELAKELIQQHLKTSVPADKSYEALNYGTLGTAALPYEETDQFVAMTKRLRAYEDSIATLQKMPTENQATTGANQQRLSQFQDSITAINTLKSTARQSYVPEKLFKISHAYLLKSSSGTEQKKEDVFYMDKDLTKVVKVKSSY
jgi:hypothetical protein